MVFLRQKREQMAALGEMAAVAQAQADLADQVQRRMQQIDGLLQPAEEAKDDVGSASTGVMAPSAAVGKGRGEGSGGGGGVGRTSDGADEEVEFWKRKIASLSAPVQGVSETPSAPSMQGLRHADMIHAETKASPSRRALSPEASAYKRSAKGSPDDYRRAEAKGSPAMEFAAQSKRSPVAPSARLSQELHGDDEVNYWRRKIAQLSTPVPGTSPSQPRSSSARSAHGSSRTSPSQGARLADEPLSWEGTQSYAEENLKMRHAEAK